MQTNEYSSLTNMLRTVESLKIFMENSKHLCHMIILIWMMRLIRKM
nr:MAG TPA: hypothetical protein [Caudoviricetes sp.]